MFFDTEFLWQQVPAILNGMGVTILCSLLAMMFGAIGGVLIGLARVRRIPVLAGLCAFLVEFVRSTPFPVQLFFLYYALPNVGIYMSNTVCGVLGLSLVGAALVSEVFRGGIAAVPPATVMAGKALALSPRAIFWDIELPIALRTMVRPLTGTAIQLFKESSVLYFIAVPEFLYTTFNLASVHFKEPEMIAAMGVFYLGGGLAIGLAGIALERGLKLERTV